MAVAYKENEEIKAYVSMKRELEAKGEKVVAASLEKEASASIEIQRRVRNVLEGYVEACAKAIGTCQTQLKRLELEYRNKNNKINE
jgi:F0F1-type ATP synthase delta subunit